MRGGPPLWKGTRLRGDESGSDNSMAETEAAIGVLGGRSGDRFLGIYMRDQLAAGVLWRELARRAQRSNEGTELGDALARVATGIAEDVATFEQLMDRLGIRRDRVKPALALVAERLGRLKLNGQLRGYSPLSRFVELEGLVMGIEGKKVLWETLGDIAGLQARAPELDFDRLIERADAQRVALEPFRHAAGREAFGTAA
jgi:hypothetical protein